MINCQPFLTIAEQIQALLSIVGVLMRNEKVNKTLMILSRFMKELTMASRLSLDVSYTFQDISNIAFSEFYELISGKRTDRSSR